MITRLLAKLDKHLLSGRELDPTQGEDIPDVLQLEDRILYSVSPLPNDPGLADAVDSDGSFETNEADSLASLGALENSEQASDQPSILDALSASADPAVTREIIFIDENVQDVDALLQDLLNSDDSSREFEIVLLSSNEDGIEQISRALAGKSGIDAVHLVTHGAEGQLQLGDRIVTTDDLPGYAGQIAGWRNALEDGADILLYGCDLADAQGREWIDSLAILCDCDVAASDDLTGHADLGGDWDFEIIVGAVEAEIAFSEELVLAWYGALDITSNALVNIGFEEGSGTTANDSTANNNDGTLTNGPSWTTDSAVGSYALDFTGDATNSNATVQILDDASLNFSDDFSVAFWYNSSAAQTDFTRVAGSHDGSEGFSIYANSDGSLNFFLDDGSTTHTISAGSGFIADSNWHHVAATFDDLTETMTLYVDGSVVASGSEPALGTISINAAITIGGENSTTSDYEGLLDDFRVYERELVSSDVFELLALGPIAVDTTTDVLDGTTTSIAALLQNKGADGFISLREAIIAANNTAGADTITLGSGTYSLTIGGGSEDLSATGDLDVLSDITINGAGAGQTIISGSGLGDRLFHIDGAGTLALNSLTVADGSAPSLGGGGILNDGTLTATDVVLRDNAGGSSNGGAIQTNGFATLTRVSLLDNSASMGGGIYQGLGTLSLTNVVVSGNSASNHGGGIMVAGGTADVGFSTFADNTAGVNTGGFFVSSGSATIDNSIFADNLGSPADISGNITSNGYNILEGYSGFTAAGTDITGSYQVAARQIDAATGHAYYEITSTDAAYNAGNGSAPATDILGNTRDGSPDIGAFEFANNPRDLYVVPGVRDSAVDAYYSFTDSSDLGRDDAGDDADMTLYSSPTQTSGPTDGGAIDFDGVNQHGDIVGLSTGGAMSMAGWVRFDSTGNWQRVFDFGQSTSTGVGNIYVAREGTTNNLTFTVEQNGSFTHRATATGAITNGTWMHFAATIDASGNMILFVNGTQAATQSGVALTEAVRDNNYIGRSHWGDAYFDGAIDDFLVVDGVLDAAQVSALYQQNNQLSLSEADSNGTVVGSVYTAHPVTGTTYTYSLSDDAGGRFAIDSATGEITLTDRSLIDYETAPSHNITVLMNDSLGGSRSETMTIAIEDAGEIVVDTTSDVSDGDTSSVAALYANKGADGFISLREAIQASNNDSGADIIQFNIAGSGTQIITLGSGLDAITDQVLIDGTTQTGWTAASFLPIVLDGNSGSFSALTFSSTSDGSEARGLVLRDFNSNTIDILDEADNITIAGNFIGQFNSDGTDAGAGESNTNSGVRVYGDNVTIGGSTLEDRNVMSGNGIGVLLRGSATNTIVSGNYIGTDAAGAATVGSDNYGVFMLETASGATIGGATAAHGNVIAGINVNAVVLFNEANDNVTIQNNIIGASAGGTAQLDFNGSSGSAIYISGGGDNAQILGNLVAGARYAGIELDAAGVSDGTVIQGNIIGTDATGTQNWGVGETGILIENATNTTIGGTGAAEGNVVAFSGQIDTVYGAGIAIQDGGSGNTIRGNSVYSNSVQGIDLSAGTTIDGVTANDAGDVDSGSNNLQNWAVLTSAAIADDGTFSYELDTTTLAAGTYTIDFYASTDRDGGQVEGQRYLGSLTGVANGNSSLTGTLSGITLASGEYLTLVTTDASGNSSEFSNYAVATDSDAGGATPSDLQAKGTSDGGLNLNNDGGNNVYLVADESPFSGQTALTIEVEFSIDTPATGMTTLFSYTDPNNQDELYLGIDTDGEIYLRTSENGGTGYGSITNAPQLFDGETHTVSVTWENTGGVLLFYVDGEQLGLGRNDYQKTTTIDAGGTVVIGQHQSRPGAGFVANDTFEGTIHSVRLFDDVRTESEIAASYQTELPHDESGMLAQWRFDNLSSDGVVTETVSGNNLTVKHSSESGFTASDASLTLQVDENAIDGTVVGSVSGADAERDALIASLLAADPDLVYSAETGKFYKAVTTDSTWTAASASALSTNLNGVGGQLATIRSAAENEVVTQFAIDAGKELWLGASDATVDGSWHWYEDGSQAEQFWLGLSDGYTPEGAFTDWQAGRPDNNEGGTQDYLSLRTTGEWNDEDDLNPATGYIIEWSADEVLDATQALTYSIQSQTVAGAFAVDSDSGQITVADGTLLDFETNATHTVTIRTTDVNSNTYDESFTISLNDLAESNSTPTDLSSGIELNTDGGNDAYLTLANADPVFGGRTAITVETTFKIDDPNNTLFTPVLSYGTSGQNDEFNVYVRPDGGLRIKINDDSNFNTVGSFPELNDGQIHSIAISWDSTGGDVAFYVDGELVETGTGYIAGQTLDVGGTLLLGHNWDSVAGTFDSDNVFRGTMYDLRVWDGVRSEAEIALNYQQKFDSGSLPTGLIANWQMDGFNGSNEVVDVVSGNNLSIGHAIGTGFTASTPVDDLHISENATNGISVGHVVPSDPDAAQDIVTNGGFHGTPADATYTSGNSFGGWTVTRGNVDVNWASMEHGPLGGAPVDLHGNTDSGAIEQTLTTEIGRQYQVVFAFSGDWQGGEATKDLRVSAGGESHDYSITQPTGWSLSNLLWENRSMTFTADSASTVLAFESLDATNAYGPMITDVQVIEIPQAVSTILNNDSTLSYDAATGKFYKVTGLTDTFSNAQTIASGSLLNGVAGQLITIDSDYENQLIRNLGQVSLNWLNASDSAAENTWRWLDDNDQFSSGSTASSGYYTNWESGQPNGSTLENNAFVDIRDGKWGDSTDASTLGIIVEWDATEVLSSFQYSLTDDAGGRFAIDSNSGEITLADGSLIDYETATSHNVTVEVTDAAGNTYSEVMSISVDNEAEATQTLPGPQTIDEDTTLSFTAGTGTEVSVTDTLGTTDTRMRVTLSVNDGVLTLSQTTGLTFVAGANGSSSLVIDGTESDINAALDGMTFTPDAEFSGSVTLNMNTALDAELTGHYTFETGTISGSTVGDQAAGTTYDGTLAGDAAIINDAQRGDVLSLDGTGDYVQVTGLLGQPSSVTLSAWINASSIDTLGGVVISMGVSPALYLNAAGYLEAYYESGGTNNNFTDTQNLVGTGWRHVAMTIDGTSREMSVYLDGQLLGSLTGNGPIEYDNSPDTYIGRAGDGLGGFDFGGLIDEARIYSRAMSGDEIAALAADEAETSGSVAITVGAVNDTPAVTGPGSAYSVNEQTNLNIHGTGFTVTDVDAASGTMTATFTVGEGTIALAAGDSGVSITANNASTVSFTGTLAQIDALLTGSGTGTIVYNNGSDTPTASTTITLTVNDGGNTGSDPGLTGDGTSEENSAAQTINLTAVNDDPILTQAPGGGTYNENGAGTFVDVSTTVTDADNLDFDGGVLTTSISNNGEADDRLTVRHEGTGAGQVYVVGSTILIDGVQIATFTGGVGVGDDLLVTFDTDADATDVEKVARRIAFSSVSENPSTAQRTISTTLTDGDGGTSTTDTRVMNVIAHNDEEVVTANAGTTVNEGSTGNVLTTAMLHTTDVDNTDAQLVYTVDAGTGNGTLRLSGTALGLNDTFTQADIDAGNVTYDHDGSQTSADSFDFTVDDSAGTSTSGTFNFTVTNVNDAPINTVPGAQSVDEDTSINITGISVADADDNLLTVQLTVGNGSLNVTLSGAATISAGSNGSADLTLSGSLSDINATLASLSYQGNVNFNGSDTLTVLSTDSDAAADSDAVAITVNAVNDSPTVGTNAGAIVAEGGSVTITTAMLNEADVDDSGTELTYTVTSGPTNGQLELSTNPSVAISSFTQDDVDSNRVVFVHDGTQASADSFGFSLADGGEDGATAATGTFNFAVTNVNDAPVVSSIEGTSLSYTENAGAIAITSTITFTDVDDTNIESASIQISAGYSSSEDVLLFSNQNGITGSFNPVSGILSLSGSASLGDYETAIRSVAYSNSSENPYTTTRTVSFTVNDGDSSSNTVTRDITIGSVNDDPTNVGSLPTDVTVTEDVLSDVDLSSVDFSDVDAGSNSLTVTLSTSTGGELTVASGSGVTLGGTATSRTFTGSLTDLNSYFNNASNIRFQHSTANLNGGNADTLTLVINDNGNTGSGGGTDQTLGTINVDISAVNDDSAVTLSGAISYTENSSPTLIAPTAAVTDVDSADFDSGSLTIQFSAGGAAGDRLDIRRQGDGLGQVNVTGPNVSYEGTVIGSFIGGTDGATPLVVSFNSNADDAAVQAVLQNITFEYLGNNPTATRTFEVTLADGDGGSTSLSENISITAVNDAPFMTSLGGDSVAATNDGLVYLLDPGTSAGISDPDNPTDFDGGSLQVTGGFFDINDLLRIDTSGSISLSAGFANGSSVSVGGTVIGTLSAVTDSTVTISFNVNASEVRVEALLQAFTYESTSSTLGGRSVSFELVDGDGTANGGDDRAIATVNIVLGSAGNGFVTTNEDTTYTFAASDFDFTGTTSTSLHSVSIVGLPTNGTLLLGGVPVSVNDVITRTQIDAGQLTFVPAADANGLPYTSFDFLINGGNPTTTVLAGEPNSFTLGGGSLQPTDEILANSSHFGPNGTISSGISVVGSSATIDAAYLAQGEVFFNGFVPDGSMTAAELSALDAWVQAGGILISNSDAASYDDVSSYYGLTIGGAGSSTWNNVNASHPIMNGPFGAVGPAFSAAGSISYFSSASLQPGDTVLATDSVSGEPTMVLRAHGSGQILFTSDEGIFRAGMTGAGTIATANDILAANIFAWAVDLVPGTETHTMDVRVMPVNDAPVLSSIEGAALNYTENDGATALTTTIAFGDIDDTNLESAVVQISSGYNNGEDVLSFTDQLGISGSYDSATGTLTLSGSATLSDYEAAIRSVTYSNTSENPDTTTRTVSFTVHDGDDSSNTLTRDITVSPVNDDPTNVGILVSDVTVTEDSLSDVDLSALVFSDVDADGESLTVTLTTSTGGNLAVASGTGITLGGTATARTFTGTLADLNSYFNNASNIQYLHVTPNLNGGNADSITVVINDNGNTGSGGGSDQTIGVVNVDIVAINDAPLVGTNTGATVLEGGSLTITSAMLNEADVDDAGTGLTYTVTSGPANGQLELTTNPGAAISSFSQDDIDNSRVVFVHDGSQTSSDSFNFALADGGENGSTPATGTFSFSVTNVNDAPVISSVEGTSLGYGENQGSVAITSTIAFSDVDDTYIESAVIQITGGYNSGEDSLAFNNQLGITGVYNSTTGTWNLTGSASLADYETAVRSITYTNSSENPDTTTRTVSFTINDGDVNSNTVTRDITISSVNDDPTNASSLPTYVTVTEDVPSNLDLSAVDFSDVDAGSGSLTVTLSTATGGELTLASGTGITLGGTASSRTLTGTLNDLNSYFNNASNIQYLHGTANTFGSNADIITVVINDNGNTGSGGGTNQTLGIINLDIAAVNDAPLVSTNTGATVLEGGSLVIDNTMLSAVDSDDSGAGLIFNITSGPTNGEFQLMSNPGTAVTSFTQEDIDNNEVVFLHDGTQSSADAFGFSVSDGGEDGALPFTGTFSFSVVSVNDAPQAFDDSVSATEDTTLLGDVIQNDYDEEGDVLTASLVSGPSYGLLTLNGDGTFSYTPTAEYSGTDSFSYRVSDGALSSAVATTTITVAAVNDAPVGTSDSYSVFAGGVLQVNVWNGVLTNDFDIESDSLSAVLVNPPSEGNLVLLADGSFEYTASTTPSGSVTFEYVVTDGIGASSPVLVEVDVQSANAPPSDNSPQTPKKLPPNVTPPDPENETEEEKKTIPISAPPKTDLEEFDSDGDSRVSVVALLEVEDDGVFALAASSSSANGDSASDPLAEYARLFERKSLLGSRTTAFPVGDLHEQSTAIQLQQLKYTLDEFQQDVADSQANNRLISGTATGAFVGATALTAVWLASGSSALALVASSLPAWAKFDPIFVLTNPPRVPEDKSLAEILEASQSSSDATKPSQTRQSARE